MRQSREVPKHDHTRVASSSLSPRAQVLFRNQIILSRDNLPTPITTLPRIGELVSFVKSALLPSSAKVQHPGNDLHVAEIVNPHSFVARPFDAIRASHALDHITAVHDGRIFGIDEVRREQPVERARVAAQESRSPLILELYRQNYKSAGRDR